MLDYDFHLRDVFAPHPIVSRSRPPIFGSLLIFISCFGCYGFLTASWLDEGRMDDVPLSIRIVVRGPVLLAHAHHALLQHANDGRSGGGQLGQPEPRPHGPARAAVGNRLMAGAQPRPQLLQQMGLHTG